MNRLLSSDLLLLPSRELYLEADKVVGIVCLLHIGIGFKGFWAKAGTRLLRLVRPFDHPG